MFSISLIINLKTNKEISLTESLIYDSGETCEAVNIYNDFELEGINKYIKKNNKIIILDFNSIENLLNFLKFIKTIKSIKIEYIYANDKIIYASNTYLNNLDRSLHSKTQIQEEIIQNKEGSDSKKIYNILES